MAKIAVENTEITVVSQNGNDYLSLTDMENLNAVFIHDGMPQHERLVKLNKIAILQMTVLETSFGRNLLK